MIWELIENNYIMYVLYYTGNIVSFVCMCVCVLRQHNDKLPLFDSVEDYA